MVGGFYRMGDFMGLVCFRSAHDMGFENNKSRSYSCSRSGTKGYWLYLTQSILQEIGGAIWTLIESILVFA